MSLKFATDLATEFTFKTFYQPREQLCSVVRNTISRLTTKASQRNIELEKRTRKHLLSD